jgi:hypothetical protein
MTGVKSPWRSAWTVVVWACLFRSRLSALNVAGPESVQGASIDMGIVHGDWTVVVWACLFRSRLSAPNVAGPESVQGIVHEDVATQILDTVSDALSSMSRFK